MLLRLAQQGPTGSASFSGTSELNSLATTAPAEPVSQYQRANLFPPNRRHVQADLPTPRRASMAQGRHACNPGECDELSQDPTNHHSVPRCSEWSRCRSRPISCPPSRPKPTSPSVWVQRMLFLEYFFCQHRCAGSEALEEMGADLVWRRREKVSRSRHRSSMPTSGCTLFSLWILVRWTHLLPLMYPLTVARRRSRRGVSQLHDFRPLARVRSFCSFPASNLMLTSPQSQHSPLLHPLHHLRPRSPTLHPSPPSAGHPLPPVHPPPPRPAPLPSWHLRSSSTRRRSDRATRNRRARVREGASARGQGSALLEGEVG